MLTIHFKKLLYLIVLIGVNAAHAGSFEDFFKALETDDARTVQQLLIRGFDPNTLDTKGQHSLYIAIREPAPKVLQLLMDSRSVNLNILNPAGESPLMIASLKGDVVTADKLVKKGADVNKTGWTPLHYAASNGHADVVKLLLENHAYIDAESPNGTTPLMMASMYGSPQVVKLLVEEGADPMLKNQQGLTALQFAERAKRPDAIEFLQKTIRAKQATGKW